MLRLSLPPALAAIRSSLRAHALSSLQLRLPASLHPFRCCCCAQMHSLAPQYTAQLDRSGVRAPSLSAVRTPVAASASANTAAPASPSASRLSTPAQAEHAFIGLTMKPTHAADVQSTLALMDDSAWSQHALFIFLKCCRRARDPATALAVFQRVTGELGVHPSATCFLRLILCLRESQHPQHENIMLQLRSQMRVSSPPVAFHAEHLLVLARHGLASILPLEQWAREDGVWEGLRAADRTALQAAATSPEPAAVSSVGPSPLEAERRASAKASRMFSQLAETRPTAADVQAAAVRVSDSAWSADSLLAFLHCCQLARDSTTALTTFQRVTKKMREPVPAVAFLRLFFCLQAAWKSSHKSVVLQLRRQMREATPPVRFTKRQLLMLTKHPRFAALLPLRRWAHEDGVWQSMSDSEQARFPPDASTAVSPPAAPSPASAVPADSDRSSLSPGAIDELRLERLERLSTRFLDLFPHTTHGAISGITDITQKDAWRNLREEVRQVVISLRRRSRRDSHQVTAAGRKQVMHLLKDLRLYDLALPFVASVLRQQDSRRAKGSTAHAADRLHSAAPDVSAGEQQAEAAEPTSVPSEWIFRAPEIAMLLECVIKAEGNPKASLPAQPAGLNGLPLAEWILAYFCAPSMRHRCEVDQAAWNVVLQGHVDRVEGKSPRVAEQLAAVCTFYKQMPAHDDHAHTGMLTALATAGEFPEEREMLRRLLANPGADVGPSVMDCEFMRIRRLIEPAAQEAQRGTDLTQRADVQALLAEAETRWMQATSRPASLLQASTVSAFLSLHAIVGDVQRQFAILEQALLLEDVVGGASSQRDASDESAAGADESDSAVTTSQQAPVFVNAHACSVVFRSAALSEKPMLWAELVDQWHTRALKRLEDASGFRRQELQLDDAFHGVYTLFLQRSGQGEKLLDEWPRISLDLKQAYPQLFVVALNALAQRGDIAAADKLVAELEDPKMRIRWDIRILTAWLSCCQAQGLWLAAERIWARMRELRLQPTSLTYTALMEVYMSAASSDRSQTQIDKIEPLYAQMQRGGTNDAPHPPLQLEARDYEKLLHASYRCRLPEETLKWAGRAMEAGLFDTLKSAARRIVISIESWQHTRRLSSQPTHEAERFVELVDEVFKQEGNVTVPKDIVEKCVAFASAAEPLPASVNATVDTSTPSSASKPAADATASLLQAAAPAVGDAFKSSEATVAASATFSLLEPEPVSAATSQSVAETESDSSLSLLTVADLKQRLRASNLKVSGSKAELVQRLLAAHQQPKVTLSASNAAPSPAAPTAASTASVEAPSDCTPAANTVSTACRYSLMSDSELKMRLRARKLRTSGGDRTVLLRRLRDSAPAGGSASGMQNADTEDSLCRLTLDEVRARLDELGLNISGINLGYKGDLMKRILEAQTAAASPARASPPRKSRAASALATPQQQSVAPASAAHSAESAASLQLLLVSDLKTRLRERGLKVSGTKAELVVRLLLQASS